jgi:hypothetical protein
VFKVKEECIHRVHTVWSRWPIEAFFAGHKTAVQHSVLTDFETLSVEYGNYFVRGCDILIFPEELSA